MKAEIKNNWINALRSKAFKQGKFKLCQKSLSLNESLRSEDSFCCLGVLCETLGIAKDYTGNGYYIYNFSHTTSGKSLPISFANSLGISQDILDKLMYINDHTDASFTDIAQFIDENLEITE